MMLKIEDLKNIYDGKNVKRLHAIIFENFITNSYGSLVSFFDAMDLLPNEILKVLNLYEVSILTNNIKEYPNVYLEDKNIADLIIKSSKSFSVDFNYEKNSFFQTIAANLIIFKYGYDVNMDFFRMLGNEAKKENVAVNYFMIAYKLNRPPEEKVEELISLGFSHTSTIKHNDKEILKDISDMKIGYMDILGYMFRNYGDDKDIQIFKDYFYNEVNGNSNLVDLIGKFLKAKNGDLFIESPLFMECLGKVNNTYYFIVSLMDFTNRSNIYHYYKIAETIYIKRNIEKVVDYLKPIYDMDFYAKFRDENYDETVNNLLKYLKVGDNLRTMILFEATQNEGNVDQYLESFIMNENMLLDKNILLDFLIHFDFKHHYESIGDIEHLFGNVMGTKSHSDNALSSLYKIHTYYLMNKYRTVDNIGFIEKEASKIIDIKKYNDTMKTDDKINFMFLKYRELKKFNLSDKEIFVEFYKKYSLDKTLRLPDSQRYTIFSKISTRYNTSVSSLKRMFKVVLEI